MEKELNNELNNELKRLQITALNEKAENVVAVAAAATAATGAVPIPFADMPLLIGEQVAMMARICTIYKIDIKKDGLKALATAAIGAGGAGVVGKAVVTNIMKLVPGVGTVAGGAISAGTAGVITLAVGKAFIEVCKANKMGILRDDEILSSKGIKMMKIAFKKNFKKQ